MTRVRLQQPQPTVPQSDVTFISSGCKVLDLALGGGWAEGRVANIVGDKSTGKTLLCIEAAANFVKKYPKGKVRYREAESAFDESYASALGFPMDNVDFGEPVDTIEDVFEDLNKVADKAKAPELYILDSLDALSDRAEMARDMDEGTYGTGKAKQLSQLFRRVVRKLEDKQITFIVVSQVRDNIGATFMQKKTTRSGGRALDFYASQVVFLAQLGQLKRTINGMTRSTGVSIRAKLEKNKIGLPFRQAEFDIMFSYGIDDLAASIKFLEEAKRLNVLGLTKDGVKPYLKKVNAYSDHDYRDTVTRIGRKVEQVWWDVEKSFLPERRKY